MSEEIKADYCIIGGGIAGILLASKLVASGKKILILDQGPRFSEEDRANMLSKSQEDINDFAELRGLDPGQTWMHHNPAVYSLSAGWRKRQPDQISTDQQISQQYKYSGEKPVAYRA